MRVTLGVNNCFAVKRWPRPADWARVVREELGIDVVERPIDLSELVIADEVFITGSAAGVQWIESIDHRPVGEGKRGPIAGALIDLYDRAVRGALPKCASWLTRTYAGRRAAAS